jgi:hypothetical protein
MMLVVFAVGDRYFMKRPGVGGGGEGAFIKKSRGKKMKPWTLENHRDDDWLGGKTGSMKVRFVRHIFA